MIDEDEYYEKRHELKEFLQKTHPNLVEVESTICDLLYSTKKNRKRKENEAAKKLYTKYRNASFSESEEQNFIADLNYHTKTFKHDTAFSIVLINANIEDYNYNEHYGKFKKNNPCVNKYIGDTTIIPNLELLAEQDGAIILNNKGIIQLTNTYLIKINCTISESQLHLYDMTKEHQDPKFYGFKQDVSTRHLSALAASSTIPNIITYTLGEDMDKTTPEQSKVERGQIRRYEQGLITLSTLFLEEKTVRKNQEYLIGKILNQQE